MWSKGPQHLRMLLADIGNFPYRELIREHIRQRSKEDVGGDAFYAAAGIPTAITAYEAASTLPAVIGAKRPTPRIEQVLPFVELLHAQLLANKSFWRINSCADAAAAILTIANQHFGLGLVVDSRGGDSDAEQELAFTLFRAATLSFAYRALNEPEVRKDMGIIGSISWNAYFSNFWLAVMLGSLILILGMLFGAGDLF